MKKIMTLLLTISLFLPVFSVNSKAEEEDVFDVPIEMTYHQNEARETIRHVNAFRKSSDAWYWNSDNTTKTTPVLDDLIYDFALEEGAMQRAAEIAVYFSHVRPNGGFYYSAYTDLGLLLIGSGENIAFGQATPKMVVDTWREDNLPYERQAHRRNMLTDRSKYYACGCVEYMGSLYWVQIFSSESFNPVETPANNTKTLTHIPLNKYAVTDYDIHVQKTAFTVGESADLGDLISFDMKIAAPDGLSFLGERTHKTAYVPEWRADGDPIKVEGRILTAVKEGSAAIVADIPFLTEPLAIPINVMSGEKELVRLSGKLRYDTSLQVAEELRRVKGLEKFNAVVLATGENFADALGGGFLAVKKEAPILLTKPSQAGKINDYIRNHLKEDGVIYVLGGEGAVPSSCLDGLEGFTVKRLSGKTRYDTNLAILEEADVTNDDILICTGENFADSLAASASGRAIFLVKNSLNDDQRAFLSAHGSNNVAIFGGTNAVSQELENDIRNYCKPVRLFGKDRFETAALIATAFYPNAARSVLAYSHDFPDGLCAGPLAYAIGAPILLAKEGSTEMASYFNAIRAIHYGYITGGEGRLPDTTVREVFRITPNVPIIKR